MLYVICNWSDTMKMNRYREYILSEKNEISGTRHFDKFVYLFVIVVKWIQYTLKWNFK